MDLDDEEIFKIRGADAHLFNPKNPPTLHVRGCK